MKTVGQICKEYRILKGKTIHDIRGSTNYQTLSSFEKGLSGNMRHLRPYLKLARQNHEFNKLLTLLGEQLCDK